MLAVRVLVLVHAERADTLRNFINTTAVVAGIVADDPDVRAASVRATVDVRSINGRAAGGRLIAVLPRTTAVAYGDTVSVRGFVEAPAAFQTDTGRLFDYPGYLRAQGVSALINFASLRSATPAGPTLRGTLFALKHTFERSLEKTLPQPDTALLEGVLLGEKSGLPAPLTQAFIIASLIHVVVLSGYNISIVAEAVLRLLRRLPRVLRYALGAVLMILFALATGLAAATVRALIMALVAMLARYLRRPTLALRSLVAAVGAMILWNPLVALYDPGFVLSVLATFGLIVLAPAVEAHLPRVLQRAPQVRSIVASTIAVQIFVLPALLYFTGVLSFVALPANILVLPLVPFAMLMGFVAGLLNMLNPILALVPALLGDAVLKWMMFVAHAAGALPLSHVTVPAFPAWVAMLVYLPLSVLALVISRSKILRGGVGVVFISPERRVLQSDSQQHPN
ncbi:MAG: ComEC/Rec2 family competence protein [Patescibacteria group bacterium]|nr:ComEC/Rec2 family competence protein [Patescibacteria group bacterium]